MSEVMSCSAAVQQLWDYLDRGLSDDDHRLLEQHLSYCVHCCGELEFARALQRLLRSAAPPNMPTDVRGRLEGFIDSLDSRDDDDR